MKNLEQIRAANAINCAAGLSRQAVRRTPALILSNGLLAAAAFSLDSESRKEMRSVWNVIVDHLSQRGFLKSPVNGTDPGARIRAFIKELSERSSLELQNATTEALAYVAYLKRFTPRPVAETQPPQD